VSGRAKWNQASRLSLLLPHGYEGNGPEHSSGRIERYLQLAAEGNIRVTVPSTAAQYFHLLRRQALTDQHKPLIVFTPKSLLREPRAASRLEDLTHGRFEVVIDDPRAAERREGVRRLLLCSGKVYYDLTHPRLGDPPDDLAIARIELLYPFPDEATRELLKGYPNLAEVVWLQEEPRNMGAWEFASRRLETLIPDGSRLRYIGRSRRASPSEGYPQAHRTEQDRLVAAAL